MDSITPRKKYYNQLVNNAREHFKNGDFENAAELYLKIKRGQPTNESFRIAVKNPQIRQFIESAEREYKKKQEQIRKQERLERERRWKKELTILHRRNKNYKKLFSFLDWAIPLIGSIIFVSYLIAKAGEK